MQPNSKARTSNCWWSWICCRRNNYILNGKNPGINWRVLVRKYLEYGRVWLFFKALPDKGLVEKGKEAKGGKKSKQRFTIAYFVNAAGEKIDEPVFTWKSKKPRCFKRLSDKSRAAEVHYFSNPKSWMISDVMQAVLTRFNRKLLLEWRKVVLILENATCHPKSIIDSFSKIKIIFLSKNSTSRLQPLDAGIIQNFKVKYRKRLIKYVLARINECSFATQIIEDVNILTAIR